MEKEMSFHILFVYKKVIGSGYLKVLDVTFLFPYYIPNGEGYVPSFEYVVSELCEKLNWHLPNGSRKEVEKCENGTQSVDNWSEKLW